jgi:RNase adapter protein RapZ
LTLLFFECADDVLQRRFTETRRRHPMAVDRPASDGIALEREFMTPIKSAADIIFDTTATTIIDLRRWVIATFGGDAETVSLTISVMSFAFRNGLPREADIVFDVRFLNNPHYIDELRPLTGLDEAVQRYILDDPDFKPAIERLEALLVPLLPRYRAEGKSYLTIAIGCTGGKHRSVYAVERLTEQLCALGWKASALHRDVPRRQAPDTGSF